MAERLRRAIRPHERQWLVAVSGGADSAYLLDQAARAARAWPARLAVAHVNYGLRGMEADGDELLVRRAAARLGLELWVADAGWREAPPGNLQDAARRLRRSLLMELAGAGGVILLAHHAGDQRENVLSALLKGKAPWGAAGMAARSGPWVRPLLDVEPAWIRDRCRRLGLAWREDASNTSLRFERNTVRHRLLAALRRTRGGEAERRLDRVGRHLAAARVELFLDVDELIDQLDVQPTESGWSLERAAILPYHGVVVREGLRELGRRLAVWGRDPAGPLLERLAAFLARGRQGARLPLGRGSWCELGRDRAWLVVRDLPEVAVTLTPGQRAVAGGWQLGWGPPPAAARHVWRPPAAGSLHVRRWRPGDRLPNGGRHPLLADVMGALGFAPAQKRQQLVVARGEDVLWSPGLGAPGPSMVSEVDRNAIWMMPCP